MKYFTPSATTTSPTASVTETAFFSIKCIGEIIKDKMVKMGCCTSVVPGSLLTICHGHFWEVLLMTSLSVFSPLTNVYIFSWDGGTFYFYKICSVLQNIKISIRSITKHPEPCYTSQSIKCRVV